MEATVMAGDPSRAADISEPSVVMAYLPRERCHVIDTWHVMGRCVARGIMTWR